MTSQYEEKISKLKNALENVFLKQSQGSNNANKNVTTDNTGHIIFEDKTDYNYGYVDENMHLQLKQASLVLTTTQPITTKGQNFTLSANLIDENNEVIKSDEKITFIQINENANNITLDTINVNTGTGIATFTSSCNTTGTIKYIAKCGDLESNYIEINSVLLYDKGTLNDNTNCWQTNNMTITRRENDTLITAQEQNTFMYIEGFSSFSEWNTGIVIEMDIVDIVNGGGVMLFFNSITAPTFLKTVYQLNCVGKKLKIIARIGQKTEYWVDDNLVGSTSSKLKSVQDKFYCESVGGNGTGFIYKNLIIYPYIFEE